jgi:hypothetical protein
MDWHELVTQACLLSNASGLRSYLEQVERGLSDRVAAILGDRYFLRYIARLLGSDVEIDRGDYILRDAIQTDVAYVGTTPQLASWKTERRCSSSCFVGGPSQPLNAPSQRWRPLSFQHAES